MIDDAPKPNSNSNKNKVIKIEYSTTIDLEDLKNVMFHTVKIGMKHFHLELINNKLTITQV